MSVWLFISHYSLFDIYDVLSGLLVIVSRGINNFLCIICNCKSSSYKELNLAKVNKHTRCVTSPLLNV